MGIVISMVIPVFTNSSEKMNDKLFYSHLESVYQKAATDAISESVTTYLEFGETGFKIISPKINRELEYMHQTTLSATDVGEQVEFSKKGAVVNPVEVIFSIREQTYEVIIQPGHQNLFINGIPISELKED